MALRTTKIALNDKTVFPFSRLARSQGCPVDHLLIAVMQSTGKILSAWQELLDELVIGHATDVPEDLEFAIQRLTGGLEKAKQLATFVPVRTFLWIGEAEERLKQFSLLHYAQKHPRHFEPEKEPV